MLTNVTFMVAYLLHKMKFKLKKLISVLR